MRFAVGEVSQDRFKEHYQLTLRELREPLLTDLRDE